MALGQSALLEALKAAEVDDRIRQAAETIYQALIEAELTPTVSTTAGDLAARKVRHLGGVSASFEVGPGQHGVIRAGGARDLTEG